MRQNHIGPHHSPRGPHHGPYEWIHSFDRAERHRLVGEDRQARTVLLILAGVVLTGLAALVVTLVAFT